MKRILTVIVLSASMSFTLLEIPKVLASPELPSQQISKQDLVLVAARAIRDQKYQLALRVATTAIKLYSDYGSAYLYRGIALFNLGQKLAAKRDFTLAKKLYFEQLKSIVSSEEISEAKSGLKVIELHLLLIDRIKAR